MTERERSKGYRARRETLALRIGEMDTICGCKSFMLTLRLDKELILWQGHPEMTARFFAGGVSRAAIAQWINVRPYDIDETDALQCAVVGCPVTVYSLSRWRLAARDLLGFEGDLGLYRPMSMDEADLWTAELDLPPGMASPGQLAVCSLHFQDGRPTKSSPLPSRLLTSAEMTAAAKAHSKNKANANVSDTIWVLAHSNHQTLQYLSLAKASVC